MNGHQWRRFHAGLQWGANERGEEDNGRPLQRGDGARGAGVRVRTPGRGRRGVGASGDAAPSASAGPCGGWSGGRVGPARKGQRGGDLGQGRGARLGHSQAASARPDSAWPRVWFSFLFFSFKYK